jgi:hypothetical protein
VRRRPALLAGLLALTAAAGALAPAHAAPPKPFSKTVTFVDSTPDPSAYFLGPEHCLGQLPKEKPVQVALPGPGVVTIAITGFTGEWSLLVTNPAGDVIGVADADAPATEKLTMRVRKAQRIDILPCNLAGTFEAQLTYSYAYKK